MKVGKFTEDNWNFLLSELVKVFGKVTVDQASKSDLIKFIASIAYVVGSEDPDRYSLANLVVAIADTKSTVWDYRESDDEHLYRRFETLNYGKKSDKELIQFSFRAMVIASIYGYIASAEADRINNVYNPINAGIIDPNKVMEELTKKNKKFYPIWEKAAPTVVAQPVDWLH